MRNKLTALICAVAIGAIGTTRAFASSTPAPEMIAADVLVVRPLCLVATVIGSVFFVISLPVAATSKSVHKAAQSLVIGPAQATFIRPLGELDELGDY